MKDPAVSLHMNLEIILYLGDDDDVVASTDPVQAAVVRTIADQACVVYAS